MAAAVPLDRHGASGEAPSHVGIAMLVGASITVEASPAEGTLLSRSEAMNAFVANGPAAADPLQKQKAACTVLAFQQAASPAQSSPTGRDRERCSVGLGGAAIGDGSAADEAAAVNVAAVNVVGDPPAGNPLTGNRPAADGHSVDHSEPDHTSADRSAADLFAGDRSARNAPAADGMPAAFAAARVLTVPVTMVRFLQAMAEDGAEARPWRLAAGSAPAQHVEQQTLSY